MAGWFENLLFKVEKGRRRQFLRLLDRIDVERLGSQNPHGTSEPGPIDIKRIAFVTPHLSEHSGGITSVLRLGFYLSRWGVDVNYITYTEQDPRRMKDVAAHAMPGLKAGFFRLSEASDLPFDGAVATFWESAYDVAMMPNVKHKAYFIQDFEPLFYSASDAYFFALNSYRLGLHMISLGDWNKAEIERTVNGTHVDVVPFPYEPAEYQAPFSEEKFQRKQEIHTCAFVKMEEKRAPFLVLKCLEALDKLLKAKGYRSRVSVFGLDKGIKLPVGENLGKLSRKELAELYEQCDFGIVASLTNISLVPYEMMACYCPVVDFSFGSFSHFFPPDTAILTNGYPQSFAQSILHYIEHPEERKALAIKAKTTVTGLSWEETSRRFLDLLKKPF